jgi:hypothetical protein
VRIEAGIVDLGVVDRGAAVGHPVGDQLGHARRVLDPDGDGVPQAAHLLAFADRRAAIGGHLQQAVEGALLVIAELAEDRRQLDRALQRFEDLLHVEVALRGRQARLLLFEDVARMAQARVLLLVIAPLDHAAFRGGRIAGVAHVGRSCPGRAAAEADLLAGAGELGVRPEEGEGMVDRHDRQILARHLRDQAAPQAGAHHDIVGHDGAAVGLDALDAAVLDDQRLGRRVGEDLELAGVAPWSISLPATVCERGMTRPASGSHRPPCTLSSRSAGTSA